MLVLRGVRKFEAVEFALFLLFRHFFQGVCKSIYLLLMSGFDANGCGRLQWSLLNENYQWTRQKQHKSLSLSHSLSPLIALSLSIISLSLLSLCLSLCLSLSVSLSVCLFLSLSLFICVSLSQRVI